MVRIWLNTSFREPVDVRKRSYKMITSKICCLLCIAAESPKTFTTHLSVCDWHWHFLNRKSWSRKSGGSQLTPPACLWNMGGNPSPGRKPTKAQEEHVNYTQEGPIRNLCSSRTKIMHEMFTINSLSSIQGSKNKHSGGKSATYCECFGKPGTEIIENNSDDVLVRNVGIATL